MDLELEIWNDGTIRLVYWDSVHGEDRVFVLDDGGNALESIGDEDTEVLTEIDLVAELRAMAQKEQEES